jgi:hypothetical protein
MCQNPHLGSTQLLNRIREILLTDYIGAITIAFLVTDGVFSLIGGIAMVASNYIRSYRSVLEEARGGLNWEILVRPALTLILSLGTAFLLAKWLYPDRQDVTAEPSAAGDQLDDPGAL